MREKYGNIYITICKIDNQQVICFMTQRTQTGALQHPRGVGGEREAQEGGDISIPLIDHVDVWKRPTNIVKQLPFN